MNEKDRIHFARLTRRFFASVGTALPASTNADKTTTAMQRANAEELIRSAALPDHGLEKPRGGGAEQPPLRPSPRAGLLRHPRRRLRLILSPQALRLRGDERGFSLLELLVVVAILGILVAAALPRFAEFRAAAYDSRSQQDLRNLAAAEELYRASSPAYADDTTLLKGFAASEGVDVALESADETSFIATASHPAGARDFRWDSSADPPLSSTVR